MPLTIWEQHISISHVFSNFLSSRYDDDFLLYRNKSESLYEKETFHQVSLPIQFKILLDMFGFVFVFMAIVDISYENRLEFISEKYVAFLLKSFGSELLR